jgi:hypothetical protein
VVGHGWFELLSRLGADAAVSVSNCSPVISPGSLVRCICIRLQLGSNTDTYLYRLKRCKRWQRSTTRLSRTTRSSSIPRQGITTLRSRNKTASSFDASRRPSYWSLCQATLSFSSEPRDFSCTASPLELVVLNSSNHYNQMTIDQTLLITHARHHLAI